MKKLILGLLAAAMVTGGAQSAFANGGWSTAGKVLTGLLAFDVATRVLAPPVVYYSAPPVAYYSSPPVVYQQAPVYTYQQAPAAVQTAPTVPAAPTVGQPAPAPAPSYTYPQQVAYAQPQVTYAQPTVIYTQPSVVYTAAPAPYYYGSYGPYYGGYWGGGYPCWGGVGVGLYFGPGGFRGGFHGHGRR